MPALAIPAEALITGVAWISFDPDSWPTFRYSSSVGKCAEMSIRSVESSFVFGLAINGTFAKADKSQKGGHQQSDMK